ncbi:MAG: rubrerythrin [Spirochaetales bacterium]|nr:MAG: rubrerythrin [Spirochaetales bacterium]
MDKFGSADAVLDFAIKEEEGAYDFYLDLSEKVEKAWMKTVFRDFAQEELGHKKKLLEIKAGKALAPVKDKVMDLNLSDYLVDAEVVPNMDFQSALILAMKKEKSAFRLYTNLAAAMQEPGLKNIFLMLAQEEAKHKLRFEIEYDDFVFQEN